MIRIKIKKPRKCLRPAGPAPCRVRAGHSAEALPGPDSEGRSPSQGPIRRYGNTPNLLPFPARREVSSGGGKEEGRGRGEKKGSPTGVPASCRACPIPPSRPPCQPACLPPSLPRLLTCRRPSRRQLPPGSPRPATKVAALRSFSLRLPPPQEPLAPPLLLFREETATMLLSPPQTPTGGSRARPERRRRRDGDGGARRARSLRCGQGAPAGGVRREPWG